MRVAGRSGPVSRRAVIGGGGAALAAALAGSRPALGQGLTGTIRVGYEGANRAIGPFVQAAADAVMAANPGATIEVEPSPAANYLNQLAIQLVTRAAPDVFLLIGLGSGELSQGGFIAPLDDYVGAWDEWDQFDPVAIEAVSLRDHVWSVPWGMNVSFLAYRRDLFQAAGLPWEWQPATRDEIIEAGQAIQGSTPEVIPLALYAGANGGNATAADFLALITSNGGTLTDPDGRWYIDNCPIQRTLEFYETAYQTAGVVPQSVMTDVNPPVTMVEAMGDGELGMLHEQARHVGFWTDRDPENAELIGLAQFPGDNGPFCLADAGDAWFINRTCATPDLAWAFIQAFGSAATQTALAIEDPHLPVRFDARQDPAWADLPLSQAMLAAAPVAVLPPPEPQFRKLIGIVQNATSLVATGEASPIEAIDRYASELTRTMGKMNVVAEGCA